MPGRPVGFGIGGAGRLVEATHRRRTRRARMRADPMHCAGGLGEWWSTNSACAALRRRGRSTALVCAVKQLGDAETVEVRRPRIARRLRKSSRFAPARRTGEGDSGSNAAAPARGCGCAWLHGRCAWPVFLDSGPEVAYLRSDRSVERRPPSARWIHGQRRGEVHQHQDGHRRVPVRGLPPAAFVPPTFGAHGFAPASPARPHLDVAGAE